MTIKRSMVFLLVLAALACDDGSGAPNDGNLAGVGGMSGAAAGGGSGSGAGGVSGTSGSGGMVAGGSGGAGGMAGGTAGGTAGASGSGGMGAGGTGGAAGMMEPTCIAPTTGGQPQPTFAWIFANVVPGCAGPPCHSSVAGGGLVFGASKDDAYAQLMMPAMGMTRPPSTSMTHCVDTKLKRVAPNDADASLLYAKLRTDKGPPCGNRMPPGSELCAPTLEAIRMWIASGAKNN
jgi:hypothetical protein